MMFLVSRIFCHSGIFLLFSQMKLCRLDKQKRFHSFFILPVLNLRASLAVHLLSALKVLVSKQGSGLCECSCICMDFLMLLHQFTGCNLTSPTNPAFRRPSVGEGATLIHLSVSDLP